MSAGGKTLKASYVEQASAQYKKKPVGYAIEVQVILYFGDKRRRDWDNYHKLSFDSLSGIVWEDDTQVQKAVVYKDYDKDNPRIEIIIRKLDEEKGGRSKDSIL